MDLRVLLVNVSLDILASISQRHPPAWILSRPPTHTHTHARFRPILSGGLRPTRALSKGKFSVAWTRPFSHLASSDRLPPCQSPLAGRIPSGAVCMQIASQLAEQFIHSFIWQPHTASHRSPQKPKYSRHAGSRPPLAGVGWGIRGSLYPAFRRPKGGCRNRRVCARYGLSRFAGRSADAAPPVASLGLRKASYAVRHSTTS